MNAGKNLKDLLEELQEMNKNQKDFILTTDNMKIDSDMQLSVTGLGEFEPTEVAHEQFADKTGIPRKYYYKMQQQAPELLASNLNHWLSKEPSKKMIRTAGGKCRAFLSDRFFAIDNIVVASLVVPKLLELGADIKSCQLTDKRLYIQAVYPSVDGEIKTGDIVQAGVCITNSDVGYSSCRVEPLIYRVVCSNGMISKVTLKKYHVGSLIQSESDVPTEVISDNTRKLKIEAVLSEMSDVLDYSFNDEFFQEEIKRLQESAGRKIEAGKIESTVQSVSGRFNLLKHEAEETMHRLIEGLDLSQYGLGNAITSMANDVSNYDRAVEYERIGGQVAFMDEEQWAAVN